MNFLLNSRVTLQKQGEISKKKENEKFWMLRFGFVKSPALAVLGVGCHCEACRQPKQSINLEKSLNLQKNALNFVIASLDEVKAWQSINSRLWREFFGRKFVF